MHSATFVQIVSEIVSLSNSNRSSGLASLARLSSILLRQHSTASLRAVEQFSPPALAFFAAHPGMGYLCTSSHSSVYTERVRLSVCE